MRRPRPASWLLALLAALAPAPARGSAGEWAVNGPSRLRLVSPYAVAPRSGELRLGIHFRTDPGWHVYWKNSGDAGYPPAVEVAGPGVAGAELLYPAPDRFELPGGLVAFGYEGDVVYPLRVRLDGDPGGGRLRLAVEVDYLVCEVDCIPFRSTLSLEQPAGEAVPDPATALLVDSWWARLPAPLAAGARGSTVFLAGPAPALEVRLEGVRAEAGAADLFFEPHDLFEIGRPVARPLPDGVAFRAPLARKRADQELPPRAAFAWTATGLAGGGSVEARQEVDLRAPAPAPPAQRGPAALAAFRTGLLLAVTPGALTLLLAGGLALRRPEAGTGRGGALAAAGGILVSCWGLALAAGRGALQHEAALLALLAVASTLLALNLWGLLPLPVPAGRAGAWRHALAGLWVPLAALAWTPSSAVRASSGPAAAAACALGLALPWLALALLPRRAPRFLLQARHLREALGFVAGAGAVWLLYPLSRQVSSEGLAFVQLCLLGVGLLAWLLRQRRTMRGALAGALALALLACALAAPWLAGRNRLARPATIDVTTPRAEARGVDP